MNGLTDQLNNASINSSSDSLRGQSAIVALKGLPQTMVAKEKLKKSDKIRQHMTTYGKVGHICTDGSANCLVQFEDRSAVNQLMTSATKTSSSDGQQRNKLVVEGHEVFIRVLDGQEEKDYWIRVNRKKEVSAKKKTEMKEKKGKDGSSKTTDSRTKGMEMDSN